MSGSYETPEVPVPTDEWSSFCDGFSRRHRGWLVDLVFCERSGETPRAPAALARGQPLWEVSIEPGTDGRDLLITAGSPGQPFLHRVRRASALLPLSSADGSDAGLRIDSEEEDALCVRFREPAPPEEVNGLAQTELP